MFTKELPLLGTVLGVFLPVLFQGINGRTSYDLAPIFRHSNQPSERVPPPSAIITGSQQTTGSVSGFVNSTAEGNGEPNSAVAYAWQGGQTSAQGSQTAIADSSNSTTETAGFSTCLQGYQGTAGGANSTSANSIGSALCNATYNQSGQHVVGRDEKQFGKGRPQPPRFPHHGPMGHRPHAPPQVVLMNNTVGQIGEAQSGQTHSSMSQAGGPTGIGGNLNILAGGFAAIPQAQMTSQQSTIDSFGKPVQALQDLTLGAGLQSEENTLIAVSGGHVGHNSGGLAHFNGLGNMFNTSYNSHAPEEEGGSGRRGRSFHRLILKKKKNIA